MAGGIGRSSTATPRTVNSAIAPVQRGGLLHRIAWLAIVAPRRTIAIAALLLVAAGIFGVPVAKSLSAGVFQDPTSESARATKILTDKFGQGDVQLLFVVSAPDGVNGIAARAVGMEIADQLSAELCALGKVAVVYPGDAGAGTTDTAAPRPHPGTAP